MSLKEFFKPDRRKIIILILIAILDSLIYLTNPDSGILFWLWLFLTIFTWLFLNVFTLPFVSVFILYPELSTLLIAIALLISVFYWYFLSCVMTWIYNKVRKR